ncbi:MAG: hypothetical protein DRM99_01855 [Thermoplasmata archaeon]|nr:MAG: hypothetical protein DRM99_01855 [Thermoplasmata archaeon]
MNKKIIVAVLISFSVIALSAIPSLGVTNVANINKAKIGDKILSEEKQEIDGENLTLPYFITTYGPISKFITKIEILDGPEPQTTKIKKLINRGFVPFSRILPAYPVFVTRLNFTVEYKINVRNNSRFSYFTINGTVIYNESGEPINITNKSFIYNAVHKIKIENFTGFFTFMHAKLFKGKIGTHWFLNPARFSFAGFCDNVTFLPVIR